MSSVGEKKIQFHLGDVTISNRVHKQDSQTENDLVDSIRHKLKKSYPSINILAIDRLHEHIKILVTRNTDITYDSLAADGIFPHCISHASSEVTEIVLFKHDPFRFSPLLYFTASLRRGLYFDRSKVMYWIHNILSTMILVALVYMCLYVQYVNKPDRYNIIGSVFIGRISMFSDLVEYVYRLK